jgi:hypothetical protein
MTTESAAKLVMEALVGIRWRLTQDETLSLIVPRMADLLAREVNNGNQRGDCAGEGRSGDI